jgi:hypothetical protein
VFAGLALGFDPVLEEDFLCLWLPIRDMSPIWYLLCFLGRYPRVLYRYLHIGLMQIRERTSTISTTCSHPKYTYSAISKRNIHCFTISCTKCSWKPMV